MEDFYYAGGLPAVMKELGGLLHLDRVTVTGKTIGENIADAECCNREVISPLDKPFKPQGGIAVLRGNLAPSGAVIKPSAATPELMKHRGRAVVFENIEDYKERIDDPALDIDETCVHGAEELRPQGLSRHGRGRQHGAAAEAAAEGRARHGAHLRRAHERHRLRHGRAARRAGSRGRRPAGAGPGRRHDRARRRRAPAASRRRRRRSSSAAAPPGRRRRRP